MASRSKQQFQNLVTEVLRGSATASPGAITTGTQGTVTVTIPGVTPGDPVLFVGTSAYLGAVDIGGAVSAADTVTVFLQNNSGGSITPTASTTYYVAVGKIDTAQFA